MDAASKFLLKERAECLLRSLMRHEKRGREGEAVEITRARDTAVVRREARPRERESAEEGRGAQWAKPMGLMPSSTLSPDQSRCP